MLLKSVAELLRRAILACGLMGVVVFAAAEARSEGLLPAKLMVLADSDLDRVSSGASSGMLDSEGRWTRPYGWFIACDAECAQQPVSVIRSPMPTPSTDLTREIDVGPVSGERYFKYGILDWVLYLQPVL